MIKQILSFLFPITIFEKRSAISDNIEVTWNNGKLVLDSKNTNYSYGSLQKVLRKGLITIGFKKVQSMSDILILGVAGGSVIKTLVDEIKFKGEITGVEIDENIIDIANKYFGLNKIKNYKTIIADASKFVTESSKKYDLIIIDIFEDIVMPNFLFEKDFIHNIKRLLNNNGFILFNTMILDEKVINRNTIFMQHFKNGEYYCKTFSNVEHFNQLILIEKRN